MEFVDCGVDIGVARFKPIFSGCWDAHIHILPEHREKYSKEVGIKLWEWVEKNLVSGLIYTNIPVTCPNVRDYLLSFGFEDSGKLKNAWLKNGKRHDMWIVTRGIN